MIDSSDRCKTHSGKPSKPNLKENVIPKVTWGAICSLKINIWRNNIFFSPFCSAEHYCLVSVSFSRSLTLVGLTLTSRLPLGDTMVTSPWEEKNALHETGSHSQDSRPQSGQHVMSLSDILERFKALTCLWENNWGVGRACFVNLLLNSTPVTQRSVSSKQQVVDQCRIKVLVLKGLIEMFWHSSAWKYIWKEIHNCHI